MSKYNLNDFFTVEGVVKHPKDLQTIDFRLDDYHCIGLTIPMSKPSIVNKCPRDPIYQYSLFQGFGELGLRFFIVNVRDWTVGYPGLKNDQGKFVIQPRKPIAKMIHYIWYSE